MERLWTVVELAEYLQVHRITVKRWIRSGELPAFLLGTSGYRVADRDLAAFLETRRKVVTSGPRPLVSQHSAV